MVEVKSSKTKVPSDLPRSEKPTPKRSTKFAHLNERTLQDSTIDLLVKMGWEYKRGTDFHPTEIHYQPELLSDAIAKLNPELNDVEVQTAIVKLFHDNSLSLIERNQNVWDRLLGLANAKIQVKSARTGKEVDLRFIDFENPSNNSFVVVDELQHAIGTQSYRFDLCLFVNGLPLGHIELKAPTEKVELAMGDFFYYQNAIAQAFYANTVLIASNGVEARYAPIGNPDQLDYAGKSAGKAPSAALVHNRFEKMFGIFRAAEPRDDLSELRALCGADLTEHEIAIWHLLLPARLLDLSQNFALFENPDNLIKKLPRVQQWRAVHKCMTKLKTTKQGGVVWHTQGSGKSITMVYLAKMLRRDPPAGFGNCTVLVLTDRLDLNKQISETLIATQTDKTQNIIPISSIADLQNNLKSGSGILCSTLQKFRPSGAESEAEEVLEAEDGTPEAVIAKMEKQLAKYDFDKVGVLNDSEDVYVLVDEAHRSHYGPLASFMKYCLPNAKFIAFTGTPLLGDEQKTLRTFLGDDYIDTYFLSDAIIDKATVPLYYVDAIPTLVSNANVDADFATTFEGINSDQQDALIKLGGSAWYGAQSRIDEIVKYVIQDFPNRCRSNKLKAMMVCRGREMAIKYQEAFVRLQTGHTNPISVKVVISLGAVKTDPIAADVQNHLLQTGEELVVPTEKIQTFVGEFKRPHSGNDPFDPKLHENTEILLVSDMLLTGYDASILGALYLDKGLKGHTLMQAIARVNRNHKNKDQGFIVDLYGVAGDLVSALEDYSGEKQGSVLPALNTSSSLHQELITAHQQLFDFLKQKKLDTIKDPMAQFKKAVTVLHPVNQTADYDKFKDLMGALSRALDALLPDKKAAPYIGDWVRYSILLNALKKLNPNLGGVSLTAQDYGKLEDLIDRNVTANPIVSAFGNGFNLNDPTTFSAILNNLDPKGQALVRKSSLIRIANTLPKSLATSLLDELDQAFTDYENQVLSDIALLQALQSLHSKYTSSSGPSFANAAQRNCFTILDGIFSDSAVSKTITDEIFNAIDPLISTSGWKQSTGKTDVMKKIRAILGNAIQYGSATEVPSQSMTKLVKDLIEAIP